MKQGDKVELRDGLNLYEVVEDHGAFALLKCVSFFDREDMGDKIYCTHVGQLIWIATYHEWMYQDASYRPV